MTLNRGSTQFQGALCVLTTFENSFHSRGGTQFMLPDRESSAVTTLSTCTLNIYFSLLLLLFRNLTEQLPLKYENTDEYGETTCSFRKCENLGCNNTGTKLEHGTIKQILHETDVSHCHKDNQNMNTTGRVTRIVDKTRLAANCSITIVLSAINQKPYQITKFIRGQKVLCCTDPTVPCVPTRASLGMIQIALHWDRPAGVKVDQGGLRMP